MPRGYKLTQMEAANRIAVYGYDLVGKYQRKDRPVAIRCHKHAFEQIVTPNGIWRGAKLRCCANEACSDRMRGTLKGSDNPFYGRHHSMEMRDAMSRRRAAAPHAFRGKPRPQYLTDAILKKVLGVPRTNSVKGKIAASLNLKRQTFEFCCDMAERGKTAGRQGIFYIVRIGNELKFGSATTTMQYRLTRHRQKFGVCVSLLIHCVVADAGAYEAVMMRAHRAHWLRGEFFSQAAIPT